MNKVIGGRRYSTDKAAKIAEWQNITDKDSPEWYGEELYRKVNGEFFLYGRGGELSPYRKATGMDEWSGSDKITPISYEEAKKWAERIPQSQYKKIFSEEDKDKRVRTTIQIRKLAYDKLKRAAGDQKKSVSEIIADLALKL